MLRNRVAALIGVAALSAAILAPGTSQAAVPDPTVTGPITAGIHGRPWFSSLVNLADHGYVEEEFFISGVSDGDEYSTRLVVRRPVDPATFSGTVYAEWVNVTGGRDLETLWPAGHPTLLAEGHAFVVVSAQRIGHSELRAWDPVRYGLLTHPGDDASFGIFAQAIQALRNPVGIDPLGPLDPDIVIATGDSQSAGRLTTYITAGHPIEGLIDGFLPGRGGGNAATGVVAETLQIPMLWILEENQAERVADNAWQKFWYQAGAAHAPMDWAHYVWRSDMRDLGFAAPVPDGVTSACSANRGEGHAVRAGIHWINKWARGIEEAPTGPRLQRDGTALMRDADGHALGGIRYPYIEAPIGVNASTGCPLFGSYEPFTSAELLVRYPSQGEYVSQVREAADAAFAQGFLLAGDRRKILTQAAAFDIWSPGAALCHDVRNGVERADIDSTQKPCPPSP